MKKFLLVVLVLALGLTSCGGSPSGGGNNSTSSFALTSSAFKEGDAIPLKHACRVLKDGGGLSPELKWTDPPSTTKSFALIIENPDAAPVNQGKTAYNWVVYNLPANTRSLAEGYAKTNAEAAVQFSGAYNGPCYSRPSMRYYFKLYALDIVISPNLKGTTAAAMAEELTKAMEGHIVAKTELMGKYGGQ